MAQQQAPAQASAPETRGAPSTFDALLPAEIARKAEEVGVKKAHMDLVTMFWLAVLAGAFIAMGAMFATTAATGASALPWGVGRLLAGLVFSLGLILVVVAGAELFTGNNLIVMAVMARRIHPMLLVRNWVVVYIGNFAGALGTALLVYWSGQYTFANGAVGLTALATGAHKTSLALVPAFFLGVLCNALVCLAVWLTMGARTTTDKILAILFPITAFVAAGFEHSVANMYFLPIALLVKGDAAYLASVGKSAADFAALTWPAFLVKNLIPVTLGNIVGGSVLVGLVYGFIYLRPRR
jgi:formate/nitrite transporter